MGLFPNLRDVFSFLLLLITLSFASSRATQIEIRNNCAYTVWAAAYPGGGKQLKQGETWTLKNITGSGRIWGRTKCSFGGDGLGKCESGDCAGRLDCQAKGRAPHTVAEYSINQDNNNVDAFYISVVEGFNIPQEFSSSDCSQVSQCAADVNRDCPMELRDPGGCNNPCTVFRNNQFCCTSGNICEPTSYSKFFRDLCRVAFTYPSDFGQRASCPTGTDYNVIFCPTTIDKKPNNSSERSNKAGTAQIGVCYTGLLGYLSAEYDVIPLYKQYNISRIRLYNPDNTTLQALRGTDIELMLGIENDDIQKIASSQAEADNWVLNNIMRHDNVSFKYIVVGNEVNPSDSIAQFLVPAMNNIQSAISIIGLDKLIKVSTSMDISVLGASYPPSASSFRSDYGPIINPLIGFLVNNSAPVLFNVYPYFTYISNTADVSLDYALFRAESAVVQDGQFGYDNLFDTILDALYSALEKAGGGSLEIVVSETGWPSDGGTVATLENARTYNSNLVRHVKGGTPKKPGRPIETYIFNTFDDIRKGIGAKFEQHWGLFQPEGEQKYPMRFN